MKLNDEYQMEFNSTVSKKGWTNFKIQRQGNRGFKAGYSVAERRFAKGKSFMALPTDVQERAHVAALQVLSQGGHL